MLNLVMASRVNREIIIPPPSGTAILRAIHQILPQMVDFLVCFETFEDFFEVFDITNIPILVMLFLL